MRKCNLCYDRTSVGKSPMCASVCPTQAIFYGTYEEWVQAGRGQQGAKPVNVFYFGQQRVRTRNYVVMREQDDALDLMALAEEAQLGNMPDVPDVDHDAGVCAVGGRRRGGHSRTERAAAAVGAPHRACSYQSQFTTRGAAMADTHDDPGGAEPTNDARADAGRNRGGGGLARPSRQRIRPAIAPFRQRPAVARRVPLSLARR